MRNIKIAAEVTLELLKEYKPLRDKEGLSLAHAKWMLMMIADKYVTHDKAHRWLGWAQCIIAAGGLATLEELKLINKRSSEGVSHSDQLTLGL